MHNYAHVIDHYSLHKIFIINDIRYNKDFLQFISIKNILLNYFYVVEDDISTASAL